MTATDGASGLAIYLEKKNDIAIVITDMSMPVMDGASLIRALLELNPSIKIVAASGLNADINASQPGVRQFLTKPFTASTLLKTVRAVIDGS